MTAFNFGRTLKQAFELPPAPKPPAGAAPTPPPPPAPRPQPPAAPPAVNKPPQRTWSNFATGTHNPSNPTFYDDYRRTMSRYLSPWNRDNSGAEGKDRGAVDDALKWGTRGAMGTAAVAGTAAGGLALGAPGLASMPVSQVPGAVAGGAAAAGTQAQNVVNKAQEFGNNIAANLSHRVPHSVQHGWHQYSEAMEPVEKTFPHIDKYTMPVEQMVHHGGHVLEHMGGGHGAPGVGMPLATVEH